MVFTEEIRCLPYFKENKLLQCFIGPQIKEPIITVRYNERDLESLYIFISNYFHLSLSVFISVFLIIPNIIFVIVYS